MVLKTVQFT